jgi:ribosomal-protein-alanine N-acetyltransferase
MVALAQDAGLIVDASHLMQALVDPARLWWVAIRNDECLGGFIAHAAADEVELYDLIVSTSHRRQGIGARLLGTLATEARHRGARRLVLEVASDNIAAQGLYTQASFVAVGRRHAYYARAIPPASDAIIMAKVIL